MMGDTVDLDSPLRAIHVAELAILQEMMRYSEKYLGSLNCVIAAMVGASNPLTQFLSFRERPTSVRRQRFMQERSGEVRHVFTFKYEGDRADLIVITQKGFGFYRFVRRDQFWYFRQDGFFEGPGLGDLECYYYDVIGGAGRAVTDDTCPE